MDQSGLNKLRDLYIAGIACDLLRNVFKRCGGINLEAFVVCYKRGQGRLIKHAGNYPQ